MSELPKGWVQCRLGDVLTLINGRAYNKDEMLIDPNSGTPILRIQNLNGGDNWFYSNLDLAEDKYCYKGDLLFAWSATFGPYWARWDKTIYHYHIWLIKPSDLLTKEFAFYVLQNITASIKAAAHGVAMPHMTKSGMESWQINIPSPVQQTRIVEKLDEVLAQVDAIKMSLDSIPAILKRFRQSVLAAAVSGRLTEEWRGDCNYTDILGLSLPAIWQVKQAKEICDKVQSGSTPRDNPFDQNGIIPFLKVYNIVNQTINFDYKPQFVTADIHNNKLGRSIAYPYDILMNIVGPPLGKVAILTDQYKEWNINQAITLFRANSELLNYRYLYYVLCEGSLVRAVMPETKGSVGQINISLSQCRDANIPLPSLDEQKEIVRLVDQYFAFADTIEAQVKKAQARVDNLTQSILAKAFRGELVAQDPSDEPAEKLLERIVQARKEAEALAKAAKKVAKTK